MRFYGFTNMYLSSIQCGIQAAHVIGNMSAKYADVPSSDYYEWATNHKTMILLNGGMSCNLKDIIDHFESDDNPYEWAYFSESLDALDGAITSVGIILPKTVYENAAELRKLKNSYNAFGPDSGISMWERKLYEIMNSCRMAQ